MKIGFLTERMLQGFGVDLVVDQLADGLARAGHDVSVYASVSDGKIIPKGYRLELIPTPASALFPRYDLSAQRHTGFLNREGVDVWLVHTFPFFSLLPRLSAPAISVEYGVSSSMGFPWKLRANFAYIKFTQQLYHRWALRIISISKFLAGQLPAGLQAKTSVVYLGADHYRNQPGKVDGPAIRAQLGVGEDEVLMLYVGRLSPAGQPYKGTAELVSLYRRLRRSCSNLRLLMVGFGGENERRWLENEGVLVISNASSEGMPSIFSACDLYVTASHWEGFDLPLVEAQSFAKPVVAFDIGAHPEVVANNSSGFLVSNLPQMGAALQALADDKALRMAMGGEALANVKKFEWQQTVRSYERVLEEVMSE